MSKKWTPFFNSVLDALFQRVCPVSLTLLPSQNLLLIGWIFSTANKDTKDTRFKKATQRAKRSTSSERALKPYVEKWFQIVCGILLKLFHCMTSSEVFHISLFYLSYRCIHHTFFPLFLFLVVVFAHKNMQRHAITRIFFS